MSTSGPGAPWRRGPEQCLMPQPEADDGADKGKPREAEKCTAVTAACLLQEANQAGPEEAAGGACRIDERNPRCCRSSCQEPARQGPE